MHLQDVCIYFESYLLICHKQFICIEYRCYRYVNYCVLAFLESLTKLMSLTSALSVSSFVSSQELAASGAVVFDILERLYA